MKDEYGPGHEGGDDDHVLDGEAEGQECVQAGRHVIEVDADDHGQEGREHDQDIDDGDDTRGRNRPVRRTARGQEFSTPIAHGRVRRARPVERPGGRGIE